MPEPNFIKLDMYAMAPGAYSINAFHQSICLYVHVARQYFGKNFTAATNTHAAICHFLCSPCHIKGDYVGLSAHPHIVTRQQLGKHVLEAKGEFLEASFSMRSVTYQRKIGNYISCLIPELLKIGSVIKKITGVIFWLKICLHSI
jgi:hypothetical protein